MIRLYMGESKIFHMGRSAETANDNNTLAGHQGPLASCQKYFAPSQTCKQHDKLILYLGKGYNVPEICRK